MGCGCGGRTMNMNSRSQAMLQRPVGGHAPMTAPTQYAKPVSHAPQSAPQQYAQPPQGLRRVQAPQRRMV